MWRRHVDLAVCVAEVMAQITPGTHHDVYNDFQLGGRELGLAHLSLRQRAKIIGGDELDMLCISLRSKQVCFVQDSHEFRDFHQEFEKSEKPGRLFLDLRRRTTYAASDEVQHFGTHGRQQLVEQVLPVGKVIVESSLCNARHAGDSRHRSFCITNFADDFHSGVEQALLDQLRPLCTGQLQAARPLPRPSLRSLRLFCHGPQTANSCRSSRLNGFPDRLRGRNDRTINSRRP